MDIFHMYSWIVSVLVAVAAVQVDSLARDDHDLKHRLVELETTVLRLVERNNRLEDKNIQFEKHVSALETEIKEFRVEPHKKVTDVKRQSSTVETVAFTAVVHPSDLHNVGAGQTIIYDKVITNVGGAYHNHTGIFTAPFNGVYVFNFAEMMTAGNEEYLELVKNGQHVIYNYGHAHGSTHATSSSLTATLELKAGDNVWVRTPPIAGHGNGEIHGNDYTTFSGWIVHIS